eukprot:CAMPEP_0171092724 /NCGR_PEP_ID=MMETSP0766_2-20121228/37065_1 /TAXON_ID=439317 /ORGANISM="Gambierdiscus australes, Strain CAWD 149" /LENGTH=145 /DNA_ID=CAMNT_0011551017 /DNA_START=51 /DNA_END=488 /DNA_ORIENTATION=+
MASAKPSTSRLAVALVVAIFFALNWHSRPRGTVGLSPMASFVAGVVLPANRLRLCKAPVRAHQVATLEAVDATMQRVVYVMQDRLNFDSDVLTPEVTLVELGMDSLDVADSALALEEEFGIQFTEQDMKKLTSVEDVVALIETKL